MSVQTNLPYKRYDGLGTTGPFEYQSRVDSAEELKVTTVVKATGIAVDLVDAVGYNATGFGTDVITVTLTANLATTSAIIFYTEPDLLQGNDYVDLDQFPAQRFEDDLDKLKLDVQYIKRLTDQGIRIPIQDLGSSLVDLPGAVSRANTALTFDANGNPSTTSIGSSVTAAVLITESAATSGQTTIATPQHEPGINNVKIIINGSTLLSSDYTETSTTTVVLNSGLTAGDSIRVEVNEVQEILSTAAAGSVSYTPLGSTVASNVQDRLDESISVKGFGAVGDGSTNDTPAIRLANTAAAGGDLRFPPGVYICDAITGATGRWILDEGATIKHLDAAAGDMIAAIGDFTIEGGTIDGNKDEQTGRYTLIDFTGDNFIARFSTYKNSIETSIRITSADTVDIHNNRFEDIAEHTGVTNETTTGVDIDEAVTFVRAHINDNYFINSAPSDEDHAPCGISLSTAASKSGDAVITGNTFVNFGRRLTANVEACIEVYRDCSRLVIANNTIYDSHSYGIRVNDASSAIIANNSVHVKESVATGYAGISYQAYNHGVVAMTDITITGNTIDNTKGSGIYCAGDPSGLLVGANISNNTITQFDTAGIWIAYCAGNIVADNNNMRRSGTYGYRIEQSEGSMKISGGIVSDFVVAGIFARTNITSLDLKLDNITIENAAPPTNSYGYTLRDMNSLVVTSCEYIGPVPTGTGNSFDMGGTTGIAEGRVEGCSWQAGYTAISGATTTHALGSSDFGKTFTNAGNTGNLQFDVVNTARIPIGFWFRIMVTDAQLTEIDPYLDTDQIFPTTNAGGDRLRNAGVVGAMVTLECTKPATAEAGTHDGAANAAVLTDSTASFIPDRLIGLTILNTTDGSSGTITAATATTVTATLAGGTDDDWDVSDAYTIDDNGIWMETSKIGTWTDAN